MDENAIIGLIGQVRERANTLITSELEARGIRGLVPSHGGILVRLYQEGPLPMGRIARSIGKKKNTVTTLVAKLEGAGYVMRRTDPVDSRVSLVELTPKGEAFRQVFDEVSRLLLDRVWQGFDETERRALVDGIKKMVRNLG